MCKRQFKTNDVKDIINYINDMEVIDNANVDFEDVDNAVWHTSTSLLQNPLKPVDMKALLRNVILMYYKTFKFKSYIIVRDNDCVSITLTIN